MQCLRTPSAIWSSPSLVLLFVMGMLITFNAVGQSRNPAIANAQSTSATEPPTAVFNIISGPDDLIQLVTAFRVAEDALANGRRVILFFNCKGVNVPVKRLPQDLALDREKPLWRMLQELVDHGAQIIVPKASADLLGYYPSDFIIATRIEPGSGDIFCKMTRNTVVFTY